MHTARCLPFTSDLPTILLPGPGEQKSSAEPATTLPTMTSVGLAFGRNCALVISTPVVAPVRVTYAGSNVPVVVFVPAGTTRLVPMGAVASVETPDGGETDYAVLAWVERTRASTTNIESRNP